MHRTRSRVAWVASLVALFALLRALRRLVEVEDRPLALGVAVCVVVVAALLPAARGPVTAEQAGWRTALQVGLAAAVTAAAALAGAGVVAAGALGIVAAALVPLAWPAPRQRAEP